MQPTRDLSRLLEIMARLRTPEIGCAWDLAQDFRSLAPYAIEEASEVVDAIEREDFIDLRDELGDLLLQVVFHAQIARERGLFDFGGVVLAINEKLIRRHPHVFGEPQQRTPEAVEGVWAEIKAREKAEKVLQRRARGLPDQARNGLLADVPAALPALARAVKLQDKASKVGFDWNDAKLVLAKIREECDEVEEALSRDDKAHVAEEIGDVLFAVANLARHMKTDPDTALRATNQKFERRFNYIEQEIDKAGKKLGEVSLADMDALWDEAKRREREILSD
ncbi:nucleoside triphosphate pyrophosphohydrolase [Rhodoblastus sphagnicola]|uniref:Nucleoside triphosphate pyrophosphohydrolase n=1 Tax=Rhodoblastus sphagnicola TaxID=333368 RepID=A0A2S6N680_9HYPH|nr:nucleoside triphosphate pyrophosphohydrolase [Rhodoblastus sphagnicola]MBB4196342.1 ATP diphosphatase [Rhodoblastus sphagnicola]PPQ30119.1 nucleoside triphosphate pyrophosphohydrolase [Rhodoblastus sphagnicola]